MKPPPKPTLIILCGMLSTLLSAEGSIRLATTTSVENSRILRLEEFAPCRY